MHEVPSFRTSEAIIDPYARIKTIESVLGDIQLLSDSDEYALQISDLLEELDAATDLADREVVVRGSGVRVRYKDGEEAGCIPFESELLQGTCLGFDVWKDLDDDSKLKVYLLVTPQQNLLESEVLTDGLMYYVNPFNSSIERQDDYLRSIEDTCNLGAEYEPNVEIFFNKITDSAARYRRMARSAKFKSMDHIEQLAETERAVRRLNSSVSLDGREFSVVTPVIYIRDMDMQNGGELKPRVVSRFVEVKGEGIAFISLYAVMPEECSSLRQDQLCLAIAPNEDTMHDLDLRYDQVIFVPFLKDTGISVEEWGK